MLEGHFALPAVAHLEHAESGKVLPNEVSWLAAKRLSVLIPTSVMLF